MLIGEIFIIEGKAYAHHYSDAGYKVVDETGTEYEEVTDEVPHNHTYYLPLGRGVKRLIFV